MTKEQEEAIEMLEDIENNTWTTKYIMSSDSKKAETVLNMLKEKDIEIEHQIEKRNNQKAELAILNEKQKELNKLTNTVKSYKGQIKRLEHTNKSYKGIIIQLNRQVDLMAEFLGERDLGHYKKEDGGEFLGIMRRYSKEDWKQYFKEIAERKNENETK